MRLPILWHIPLLRIGSGNDAQPKEQQAQAGGAEKKEGEMSPQEAAALLDSERDQDVRPDEVLKKLQGAVVGEPTQDW